MKNAIIKMWKSVQRAGIENLLDWLETSDFYTAPCSTEFHLCRPGGLMEHSLNVYRLLDEKAQRYGLYPKASEGVSAIMKQTVIVCALGHDLCKANFYVPGHRNVKNDVTGQWERKSVFKVKDQFPMGHGEKSVSILQEFVRLTEIERLAIRWHMCAFDPGIHFFYPSGSAYREAVKVHPLVTLLFTADYEASNIIETEE